MVAPPNLLGENHHHGPTSLTLTEMPTLLPYSFNCPGSIARSSMLPFRGGDSSSNLGRGVFIIKKKAPVTLVALPSLLKKIYNTKFKPVTFMVALPSLLGWNPLPRRFLFFFILFFCFLPVTFMVACPSQRLGGYSCRGVYFLKNY